MITLNFLFSVIFDAVAATPSRNIEIVALQKIVPQGHRSSPGGIRGFVRKISGFFSFFPFIIIIIIFIGSYLAQAKNRLYVLHAVFFHSIFNLSIRAYISPFLSPPYIFHLFFTSLSLSPFSYFSILFFITFLSLLSLPHPFFLHSSFSSLYS